MKIYSHVIMVDGIDDTQRFLINTSIKDATDDWWHNFPNVWIVQSELTLNQWMNRLHVFVPASPSSLLVISLADHPAVGWRGEAEPFDWLKGHFDKSSEPEIKNQKMLP